MYTMYNKKKYVLTCQTIDLNANLLNLVVKLPPAIQNVIFYKKKILLKQVYLFKNIQTSIGI